MPLRTRLQDVRLGVLVRRADISGVSGTGWVAFIVQWPSGHCATEWWDGQSHGLYESLDALLAVHGHGDATVVEWLGTPDA